MTQTGDAQGGAQQGGAQGAGVVDQAKDTIQQFAGQAKEQATQRAQGAFEQGKQRAAEQLTGVAQTLRQTTEQLQSGGQLAFAAPYLDRGVGQLERLAEYVRTADAQDVARQAERFARQQPALFLGILFGVGAVGARFLKSSQRDAAQSRYPNYGSYDYGTSGSGRGGYDSGYGSDYGSTGGSGYGASSGGAVGGSYGSVSGTYTGSNAGSQGSSAGSLGGYGSGSYGDASGSASGGSSAGGSFYDDAGASTGGSTGGGSAGGYSRSQGGSQGAADDERGMDIGPTSSGGLRGDI